MKKHLLMLALASTCFVATQAGAQMLPPMPAFYNRPASTDDIVNHIVSRVLDQFGLDNDLTVRWTGPTPLSKEKT